MTDMSLFYESEVTTRSVYRAPGSAIATLMKPGTMTVDAETSSRNEETDRRRAAWMVAAQAATERPMKRCCATVSLSSAGSHVAKGYDPIS